MQPSNQSDKLAGVFWALFYLFNPLSANFTKWSNILKQFIGKLPTNCLSVFDHFVVLALKRLRFKFKCRDCCNGKTRLI